jgi:hypothetical protein
VSSIKVRNSKPVRLVLEAVNEQEEKKRRAIAFREATEEEKRALQIVSQIKYESERVKSFVTIPFFCYSSIHLLITACYSFTDYPLPFKSRRNKMHSLPI